MTVSSGTNRAIHRAQPPRGIYPARRNTRRSGCFPRREASSWLQATALKILTDSVCPKRNINARGRRLLR